MSPCRCDPQVAGSCQCTSDSTTTIQQHGSGTPGSPFTYTAILSAITGNKLTAVPDGLLVETLPWLRSYASSDQTRAKMDALAFDSNDVDPTSDPGIHSTSGVGTDRYFFVITRTGLWVMFAQAAFSDGLEGGTSLRWQDSGGNFLSADGGNGGSDSPNSAQAFAVHALTAGTHVQVSVDWDTGAASAIIQGGASYGHRTWVSLICIHAF